MREPYSHYYQQVLDLEADIEFERAGEAIKVTAVIMEQRVQDPEGPYRSSKGNWRYQEMNLLTSSDEVLRSIGEILRQAVETDEDWYTEALEASRETEEEDDQDD